MATGTLFPAPWFEALDGNGKPISGAKLNFYIAGTSTPATTYSDVALTIANTNPVVADGFGRAGPIFLTPGQSYKLVLTDASNVTIRTQDNIQGVPTSSNNVDIIGVAGQALSAGQPVYLSDGSGAKTAGQWFPADSTNTYSSTLCEVGMAPAAIGSGASGTIRMSGQVTGLSSLTVGTSYYIGVAGVLTSTAPANSRLLGVADTTSSLIIAPKDPATLLTAGQAVFPSTQNPSTDPNTLDDYEEQTWVPVLGGSGGTSGQTYSVQQGSYIKIGKLVFVTFTVTLTAKGTITTNAQIQGLPFTSENTVNQNASAQFSNMANFATTWASLTGILLPNATALTIQGIATAATGVSNLTTTDISNTTSLSGTIQYRAAQ